MNPEPRPEADPLAEPLAVLARDTAPLPTRETHHTRASDGWPLTLHRYPAGGSNPHGEPVLLQHGLGTSSLQFDLPGTSPRTPSLARWLAARGYDVWAGDLRGIGDSALPGASGRGRWSWSVDDHLHEDMPAFVRYVLDHSNYDRLHWVGHSMGGILLLCYCALHGSSQIASGVVAGGALDYSGGSSRYDLIVPLRKIGRLIRRVPAGTLSRLLAPFAGRLNTPIEASFYYPPNMAPDAARVLLRAAQFDVSGEQLHQLATLFTPGGLRSVDGRMRYADRAHAVRTPMLLLAGERDLQCTPPVIDHTRTLLGDGDHRVMRFGRSHGHVEHYGHFDLLAGVRAAEEVFPHLLRWIQVHGLSTALRATP